MRGWIAARLCRRFAASARDCRRRACALHSLVEHTSINPNKAAHVGHLRNAILGDTFVRLLRAAGQKVDVQNYIDNTGVQVADVVVGLMHLEGLSLSDVRGADGASWPRTASASITTAGICMRGFRSGTTRTTRQKRRRARKLRLDTLHAD